MIREQGQRRRIIPTGRKSERGEVSREPLLDLARILNRLRRQGVIEDWAIYGSVAFSLWTVPITTNDIDVLVPVFVEGPVGERYDVIADVNKGIDDGRFGLKLGIAVEILPAPRLPFYAAALKDIRRHRRRGESINLLKPEYLLVLALLAWRKDPTRGVDDEQRARLLWERVVDRAKTTRLVNKYARTFPRVREETILSRFSRIQE